MRKSSLEIPNLIIHHSSHSSLSFQGGNVIEKIEGANGPELATKVARFSAQLAAKQVGNIGGASTGANNSSNSKEVLHKRLEKLVNFAPVMVFIKGTPSNPQCGFSGKLIDILKKEGAQFESFNILSDEEVRTGLKVRISLSILE